jgi:serine/threonine protein kinase
MSDLVGKSIGQYQIVEQIGQGGMATIFKAHQPSIDRYVAIKILPNQFAQDPNFVKRFEHEAKAIAALEHPHILPVHDFGTKEGRPYTVMRYVEGGTLADLMGNSLTYERIVQIIGSVARALDYAHQRGVVHRDIKPSNILIDKQGEVLLADFGIAKTIEGVGATQLTGTGSILGTPAYMAPEQAESAKVDGRTDIYSLGVILYELLTGQPPYQADTPLAVVLMHLNEPLPLPRSIKPDIPESLEQIVLKAMAKAPNERFQTAGDMEQALKLALRGIESVSTTGSASASITQPDRASDTDIQPSPKSGKTLMGPMLIGTGIVALLLCLVGGGIVTWAVIASRDERIAEVTPESVGDIQAIIPINQDAPLTPESTAELPVSNPTSSADVITEDTDNDIVIDLSALGGEMIFEDRFDSTRNGWSIGEDEDEYVQLKNEIVDGRYRMSRQAKQGAYSWEQPITVNFDDFVLSVDAIPVEQTAPFGYGIIFRATAEDEYYTFLIDEGKAFSVFLFAEDEWRALVASRRMSAINSNSLNQLAVKAVGPSLTFYINGVEAVTVEDDALDSGSIGLAMELYEAGDSAIVEFDNLIVRQIERDEEQAAQSGDLIFAEYFDSDTNGWATGQFENEYSQNEVTIVDGRYTLQVNSKEPAFIEKNLPNRRFSNFILTLEATPGDDAEYYSYGIAFRENSDGYTYTFEIGNDGLYAIFLYNGEWKTLKDWSSNDAIEPGQTNEITVVAKGNNFTFFVNEKEMTTLEDDTLAEGEIGLVVEVFETGQSAAVDFDNLVIRTP